MMAHPSAMEEIRKIMEPAFTASERNPVAASLMEEIGITLGELELMKDGVLTPQELYERRTDALEKVLIEASKIILKI